MTKILLSCEHLDPEIEAISLLLVQGHAPFQQNICSQEHKEQVPQCTGLCGSDLYKMLRMVHMEATSYRYNDNYRHTSYYSLLIQEPKPNETIMV